MRCSCCDNSESLWVHDTTSPERTVGTTLTNGHLGGVQEIDDDDNDDEEEVEEVEDGDDDEEDEEEKDEEDLWICQLDSSFLKTIYSSFFYRPFSFLSVENFTYANGNSHNDDNKDKDNDDDDETSGWRMVTCSRLKRRLPNEDDDGRSEKLLVLGCCTI
ncbi:hypothetical protein DPMN_190216 [Dreissena polymorpha]|uniref:Uncharacterized protein n=1 Tax=Dreissena polymorpha TaxID=45954 RepID=A0A9D4DVS2_DREPO|nr:hypothetical protein DPMN_190216 [Dreissena polymorpha]